MLAIIQAAGWPIWPLILCSVAALTLVIERALMLRRVRVAPTTLVDEVLALLAKGPPSTTMMSVLERSCVLGEVLASGLRAKLVPGSDEASLRRAFEVAGANAAHRLERYLPVLALIASAAPLLGLLGTVIGMIEIFGAQGVSAGGNPAQLAHGISMALYNTAFGLMVAIPALFAHRLLRGRVAGYVHEMEQGSERVLRQLVTPRG